VLCQRELTVLVLQGVDVHGSIGRLGCDVFVHGIPCHALNVVVVLGDLAYNASSLSVVYAGNVVHTSCDEEDAVWRPGKVVNLRAYRPAHGLDPPCLLVFETLFEVVRGLVLSWNPQQDVAIVAGAREHFASWTPSYHIHSLCVLYEG
jgi:hypothetical protein